MSPFGTRSLLLILLLAAWSPAAGQQAVAAAPDRAPTTGASSATDVTARAMNAASAAATAANAATDAQIAEIGGAQVRQALLSTPSGDTVAILGPNTHPEVLEEQGDWIRVRLEGWTRRADLPVVPPTTPPVVTFSDVRGDPEAHVGVPVRWTVQNLGLQRADSLRSDMRPGQNYLLARDPGGETGMVYITVPDDLLTAAATIGPLERFDVVGRVVSGRSTLTGHPILELLELH